MASDIAVHIRGLKGCLQRPEIDIPNIEDLFQTRISLANRLSTSIAQRNLDALEAHVKQSQAIVNRYARELDAAILNNLHPVLIHDL